MLSVKGGSWISFSLPKNDKRKLIEAMKAAEGRMGEINPLMLRSEGGIERGAQDELEMSL